jgi:membrane associated rhomboid family serine protease
MRGADEETMVELEDNGFIQPYEFLSQRSPSIISIFFPRKTVKSINFWLSVTYILMFIILLGMNYSRTQTDLSWNCTLFKLQCKYFPKLRFNMEFQRVIISALLHSNLAHFFLDLFALQVYGYFV